jgi:hypothetical protein
MSTCIACDLAVFTPEARRRHEEDTHALLDHVTDVTERSDGFVFRIPDLAGGDAALVALVQRWIDDERRCCPFLAFTLGRDALTVTGPEGAKDVLRGYSAFRMRMQGSGVPSGSTTSNGSTAR